MSNVVDDYSPIYKGDRLIYFAPVFTYKSDGSPFDLDGVTITMKMQNEKGTVKTCDPTKWTTDNAGAGQAHYQWQAVDVDTPGVWTLFITLTKGGLPVTVDVKTLEVLAIP